MKTTRVVPSGGEQQQRRRLVKNLHPSMHIHLRDDASGAARSLGMRQRIYHTLERPLSSRTGTCILAVLMLCILASIVVYYVSSIGSEAKESPIISALEYICTVVFTVELMLRLYVGTLEPRQLLCDATLFIDALSVLPFYFEVRGGRSQIASLPQAACCRSACSTYSTLSSHAAFHLLMRLIRSDSSAW